MNKVSPPITIDKNAAFASSPSLLTAGLPSGSMMTTPLISPSVETKQSHRYPVNQNRFTYDQSSQSTIVSHRTTSDTYLTLSRDDINDVMIALHTLARCIQDEYPPDRVPIREDDAHRLAMLYAKSTNHTLKTSSQLNGSSGDEDVRRYSIRRARPSCSSDLRPGDDFRDDLHQMKRGESSHWLRQCPFDEDYFTYHDRHHHLCGYPSLSSNAILYTSACESNQRFSGNDHCSRPECQRAAKEKFSSSIPLPSYILDKLIYIHRNEPVSNMKLLPQQAQTLQILQVNPIRSLMSIDSLNMKEKEVNPIILNRTKRSQPNWSSDTTGPCHLKSMDVATQWSLQSSGTKPVPSIKADAERSLNDQGLLTLPATLENATILTDISHSTATLITTHSTMPAPSLVTTQSTIHQLSSPSKKTSVDSPLKFHSEMTSNCSKPSSTTVVDESARIRSETERFLIGALDTPTCRCSPMKLSRESSVERKVSTHDNVTCLSWNDDSAINSSAEQKLQHRPTIKAATKRTRRPRSKSLKNKSPAKRSRPRPSPRRTLDRQEESSFDFFDMDTTFFDTYDRLFTDTATLSDKSNSPLRH